MYEHVGRAQLGRLRRARSRGCCARAASFLNHGIARLALRAAARRQAFIQRYVFPDGELHAGRRRRRRAAGRRPRGPRRRVDARALRADAAALARQPRRRPRGDASPRSASERDARLAALHARLGAGFEDGDISVYQVLAARPGAAHGLPLSRGDLAADARAVAPGDGRA